MPPERPTFSESWYRVESLRPRLRSTLQTYRQHFRGQVYHVVQDPTNNSFFRVGPSAYHFIGMLDGQRSVGQVWDRCNERLGDQAPTQNEVIQLLGQLYASNLIQAELAPDAEGMFNRYRKRVNREIGSYLMNILFARIPLLDPDRFLDRWVKWVGWFFSPIGFALWVCVVGLGLYQVVTHADRIAMAGGLLDMVNWDAEGLGLLYLSFIGIKAIHELGHGFSCKTFGNRTHSGGEVHTIGIMFLVGMPVPYVDASSAWAFRSKWHRAVVGMAGMYVELFFAAIAAYVWAITGQGSVVNAVAFNVMFIASVSTLLFNANPLLRFDGYYILSDLLEIPNLAQRSSEYFYYLVKRYAFGVKRAIDRTQTPTERVWLLIYAMLSTVYRFFISIRIILFIADKFFFIGALMAIAGIVGWVVVPMGKFVNYLATSHEIDRVRTRAIGAIVASLTAGVLGLAVIPAPDRGRAEGVVEPVRFAMIAMGANGFIEGYLPDTSYVTPDGQPLIVASNPELVAQRDQARSERDKTYYELQQAMQDEPSLQQSLRQKLEALDTKLGHLNEQLASLTIHAPFKGLWVSPQIESSKGVYLDRGQTVGMVASDGDLFIRAVADQRLGPRIAHELHEGAQVELRVRGVPTEHFKGRIEKILRAGQTELPSAALGYRVGGNIAVSKDDRDGKTAVEPFTEVHIRPDPEAIKALRSGQRVVVRFDLGQRPLGVQWYRSILQTLQSRFRI
ncbi:MAG: hypothetical protein GC164_14770 [Phycisphaera sp.]|nr:hypothetical protein [Phycisphaera sp.]